jgi:alpha-galactosidase
MDRNSMKEIKIAYIGGGSRGWAWTLMGDLSVSECFRGKVALYDIDFDAAKRNEEIGNRYLENFIFRAERNIKDALNGADFVVISILPGTFDEMEIDVHAPEKYGVWQSVGDTTGPGGFIRALRTVPMMRRIARAIAEYSPDAYVINYTNPMAVCVDTLYREFPGIKAFGCCHEVFGTQKLLASAVSDILGTEAPDRHEIKVNVTGVNHFTWFTEAHFGDTDLFPVYRNFVDKYYESGYLAGSAGNWMNDYFKSGARVRFDLFRRFGYIAAAGDRHLAEFMDPGDYLASPEQVRGWTFSLTPVSWRKKDLEKRLAKSDRLLSGEEPFKKKKSGEEGTRQMAALSGLGSLVTNINLPNTGQIPDLPSGTVVETNALLDNGVLRPLPAGKLPDTIAPLVTRIARENSETVDAAFSLDLSYAREVFRKGHSLSGISAEDRDRLFEEMTERTKNNLTEYKK